MKRPYYITGFDQTCPGTAVARVLGRRVLQSLTCQDAIFCTSTPEATGPVVPLSAALLRAGLPEDFLLTVHVKEKPGHSFPVCSLQSDEAPETDQEEAGREMPETGELQTEEAAEKDQEEAGPETPETGEPQVDEAAKQEAWKARVLAQAVVGAAQSGDNLRAQQVLQRIIRTCTPVGAMPFNAVIDACTKTGDMAAARRWLQEMRAAGVEPNSITYNILMEALAKADDAEEIRVTSR